MGEARERESEREKKKERESRGIKYQFRLIKKKKGLRNKLK